MKLSDMQEPGAYHQSRSFENAFIAIISQVLTAFGYQRIELSKNKAASNTLIAPDLTVQKGGETLIIDVKFYRNRVVNPKLLIDAGMNLFRYPDLNIKNIQRIIIVSNVVPAPMKNEIHTRFGLIVWDRENLMNFITNIPNYDLLNSFVQLLADAQQGIDTAHPFDGLDFSNEVPDNFVESAPKGSPVSVDASKIGNNFAARLKAVPIGKDGWAEFETLCIEILHYLFDDNLSGWHKQPSTDDGLSRFDLICRIKPEDDFWMSLVQAFQSRFVLFEFKNYSDKITQAQIYTTERYLFPKALRSVAIIICRSGWTSHALAAAKGALREHGKLILLLTAEDLEYMLDKRDIGSSPNDSLGYQLDNFLLTLSR